MESCENCEEPSCLTLSCFHSFCENCLCTSYDGDKALHACLTCGATTRVDASGMRSLQLDQRSTCGNHESAPLSMYCETCQKLICINCSTSDHQGHHYKPSKKCLLEFDDEVKEIMANMSTLIAAVSQAASQKKSQLTDSEKNLEVAKSRLSSTIEMFHCTLTKRKDSLLYQLEETSEDKTKELKLSCKNLYGLLVRLNGFLSCLEKSLATVSEVELLCLRSGIIKQSNRLQNSCQSLLKNTVASDNYYIHTVFKQNEVTEILSTAGRVEISQNQFEDLPDGKVDLYQEPTLSLKLSIERHNSPLLAFAGLRGPTSVAIGPTGEIVIAESCGDQISFFSPTTGQKLNSFGTCGSSEGEFRFPSSIAIDSRGDILVVDGCNNRIQKYSSSGKYLTEVGSRGKGELQFCEPEGLAINPANKKIYVVDNNSHRIQVLNEDLTFSFAFGSKGLQEGGLYYPWGIACSAKGDVYVTDSGSCYIKVFTSKGQYLREFGSEGDIEGCLRWPTGICVTENGVVYVSDYGNHRIAVFTSEGKLLQCFGSKGSSWEEFGNVRGLAIDKNGILYICDTDNDRVLLY